jgi:two-component sensor histidine kinase
MNLRKRLTNFGIALVIIWLAMAIYALLQGVTGLWMVHHYNFKVWSQIRSETVYIWSPLLPLTPLVFWFATRFPFRPDARLRWLLQHLGMMTVFALLHGYMSAELYYRIGLIDDDMRDYQPWQHAGHFLFTHNNMFVLDALIYSILICSQNISLFHQRIQQHELDAARLEGQLAQAKLQALKMQINPHFLFNTLNSISVLVKKGDNASADEMLARLSDFFRQTLEQGEEQSVLLRQELELMRHYLAIEQVRFGDRLQVDYQVDADVLDQAVPVLILQPLVENAIKHGLSKKVGPCRLRIEARKHEQGVWLCVSDDGLGADAPSDSGVGLRNVRNRLQALYQSRQRFEFTSTPGQGTRVSIVLGAVA